MISGVTSQYFGQGAFSRAVWAHERVHLTARHAESQSANNLLIAHGDVQVLNVQFLHKSEQQIYVESADLRMVWGRSVALFFVASRAQCHCRLLRERMANHRFN